MKCPDAARAAALRLLCEFELEGTSLEVLLQTLDQSLPAPRDRRFARQLALGVLRWRGRLDWILGHFLHRPLEACSPWVRQLLRLGAYQFLFLDKVPAAAAVHTSVELARFGAHRAAASLVNAVLRRALREAAKLSYPPRREDAAGYLSVYYSHPRWLVERWLERWGDARSEALLRANNEAAPLYLRLNALRTHRARLDAGLELRPAGPLPGYFALEDPGGFFESAAYREGFFQVQDINAGLAVALLDPRPGERILDACSAPGGKTTQMGELMQNRGLIVAADRSRRRLRRVGANARRLGLRNIHLLVEDSACGAGAPFDRVLVDAPCSGTGVLGRHPDARWRKQAAQLGALAAAQGSILRRAFARLRPGGVLVYSTCSLEEEENAGVVESFLAATPTAILEAAAKRFPGRPWAGRFVQTLPGREPGDGSFAARIGKEKP